MSNTESHVSPPNFVGWIYKSNILLENVTHQLILPIKQLGAYEEQVKEKFAWKIDFSDDRELVEKLCKLNALGFLFMDEPAGWPPAAVFERLQEKYHIKEKFKKVTWRGPGDWIIIEG